MEEKDKFKKTQLDHKLINLVKERPELYHPKFFYQDNKTRQALWLEISKKLDNELNADAARDRWKNLRSSYVKAKHQKKVKEEAVKYWGGLLLPPKTRNKNSYKYFKLMEFLEDSLCYQPKPDNNLPPVKELNKVTKMPNIIRVIPIAPKPSGRQSTITDIQAVSAENVTPFTLMHLPSLQNPVENESSSKINGDTTVTDYDKIFLECLQRPIEQPSPIDGFLIRLGEGLKRLPYKERSKLELEFLQRLYEIEEQLENCNKLKGKVESCK